MKKIVYISLHNPFGKTGGGALASKSYLNAFCKLSEGNIDLITCKEDTGPERELISTINAPQRNLISKACSVFTGYMNRYVEFVKQWLYEHHNNYSTIVFDHSGIGGPLVKLANNLGLQTITIHHNYEREYFYDNSSFLYRVLYLHHVVKWEKTAYKHSKLNLFLTNSDLCKFREVYGSSNAINKVIGTFEPKPVTPPVIKECAGSGKKTIAITGSLQAYQTEDAIKYFFNKLYPLLPPNINIIIAGRNPSNKLINICQSYNNVKLIPNPDNMNDVISQCDIYVCATRIGGGLKLRVMDGLRCGKPIITHSCSARGFEMYYDTPFFKVFTSPKEFKEHVLFVLDKINHSPYDPKVIQKQFQQYFSFESGYKRLQEFMTDLQRNHNNGLS